MHPATWLLLLSAAAYCTTRPAADCSSDVIDSNYCAHRIRHQHQYMDLVNLNKLSVVPIRYQSFTLNESTTDCKIFKLIPIQGQKWITSNTSLVRTIKSTVTVLLHSKFKLCYPYAHYFYMSERWYSVPYDISKLAGGRYPTLVTSKKKAPVHWTRVLEDILNDGDSILPWRSVK